MLHTLIASDIASDPSLVQQVSLFFQEGGFFMILLGATSVVGLAAILFKMLSLRKVGIVPDSLVVEVERLDPRQAGRGPESLSGKVEAGDSVLARLSQATLAMRGRSVAEINEAVQSLARAEIIRLHAGMTVIDVVISVAPLLGLLGTASGLVVVFSGLEQDADWMMITGGIGRALKTTIVGMAIAVPSIIAQGFFQRQIDTFSVRLEVLLTRLAHVCEGRGGVSAQPSEIGPDA
ncbi:MAG: MotA/TolQ/ExbB proton channel family protein [Verrucomicrobiales bacterium]